MNKEMLLDSAYVADNPASFATVLALRGTFYQLDVEPIGRGCFPAWIHLFIRWRNMHT